MSLHYINKMNQKNKKHKKVIQISKSVTPLIKNITKNVETKNSSLDCSDDLKNKLDIVNKNIDMLIKSEDAFWIPQRNNLKKHLSLNLDLIKKYDLNNPIPETLRDIEKIKEFRTYNLNTPENIKHEIYSRGVGSLMCEIKVEIMKRVYTTTDTLDF